MAFNDEGDPDPTAQATPRRRGALASAAKTASSRFSLAHELAAAMSPAPPSNARQLAEEYGIELDEEDEEMEVEDVAGADSGREAALAALESRGDLGEPSGLDGPFRVGADVESLRTRTSILSLGDQLSAQAQAGGGSLASELGASSGPMSGVPMIEVDDEAHYEATSAALADSLETTDVFLSKLRSLTSAELGSASRSTRGRETDEPSSIERVASDVIKRMYEVAREREAQVRELAEMNRAFARPDAEWQAVLGELDSLPERETAGDEDDRFGGALSGTGGTIGRNSSAAAARRLGSLVEAEEPEEPEVEGVDGLARPWEGDVDAEGDELDDEDEAGPRTPSSTKRGHANGATISNGSTPTEHLSQLRTLTSSLISTLSNIHEHTQVNRATTADAGRKLRSLKGVLSQWRTEMEGVQKSVEWIEKHEGGADGAPPPTETTSTSSTGEWKGRRPDDIKRWTAEQMKGFELALGDAEAKARQVLTPVA